MNKLETTVQDMVLVRDEFLKESILSHFPAEQAEELSSVLDDKIAAGDAAWQKTRRKMLKVQEDQALTDALKTPLRPK